MFTALQRADTIYRLRQATLPRQVAKNFAAMYYQHLENQGIDIQEEIFQAPKVISRIPRLAIG
jgi:hypothetical protein